MKAFGAVAIFVSGLLVGHTMGTVYGAALMTKPKDRTTPDMPVGQG